MKIIKRKEPYEKDILYTEEENPQFINGLAIIQAYQVQKPSALFLKKKRKEVIGIINENYEEAFSPIEDGYYLSFSKEKQSIQRFGNDDFIVEETSQLEENDYAITRRLRNYYHIKIKDHQPILIKDNLGIYIKTQNPFWIIIYGRGQKGLYDMQSGFYLTSQNAQIYGNEQTPILSIVDPIFTDGYYPNLCYICDYLTFQLDTRTQKIVSPIYSCIENQKITNENEIGINDYPKIYERQKNLLLEKMKSFQSRIRTPDEK